MYKSITAMFVAFLLGLSSITNATAASPVAGKSCTKLGQKVTFKSNQFTCTKSGKKLVWSKGVAIKKPTPTPTPTPKSTFFSTTTSTANLEKLTVTRATTTETVKAGKSLQVRLSTVGSKSLLVKVQVKDPSGKSYQIASRSVEKNKSFSTPIMKFAKKGTYVVTINLGTSKRVITVKVA